MDSAPRLHISNEQGSPQATTVLAASLDRSATLILSILREFDELRPRRTTATLSEKNLHRYLANPRIPHAKDHTEGTGDEVSVWIQELSMVEDIEKLGPELGAHALRNSGVFQQGSKLSIRGP